MMVVILDLNLWLEDVVGSIVRGKIFYVLLSCVLDLGIVYDWEWCELDIFGRMECFYDIDRYIN